MKHPVSRPPVFILLSIARPRPSTEHASTRRRVLGCSVSRPNCAANISLRLSTSATQRFLP